MAKDGARGGGGLSTARWGGRGGGERKEKKTKDSARGSPAPGKATNLQPQSDQNANRDVATGRLYGRDFGSFLKLKPGMLEVGVGVGVGGVEEGVAECIFFPEPPQVHP